MSRTNQAGLRYGVAVLAVAAAVALVLQPAIGRGGASIPFFAVLISAWFGGIGPGLFSTALTVVVYLSIVLGRGDAFRPWQVLQVVLFVAGGFLISFLVEALHAARRRAEVNQRWLSAVLTSIGDAVIATDGTGRITFTNPVAQALTGWSQAEATGRPLGDVFSIVSEVDRRPVDSPSTRVIRDGAVVGLDEHTLLIARDGTERPVADSAAPIKSDAGGIVGVVLVFRDVANERRHEQEREDLLSALRENDRHKDEFLAMLAHELRNPLAAIGSALRLSGEGGLEENLAWTKNVISRQLKHLTRLIDDLLDVSRITRGKIGLRAERVDAATLIASALDAIRPLTADRLQEVTGDVPRGEFWLDADPTRFEQVLVNLLTNAAKYTQGGGRISVSARKESGEVVISVRDNGTGIPANLLHRVFDLFTQGDRTLARSEGGLGIGLTVVKKLVELHGGTVTAKSDGPGLGSEFCVRLPAAEPPSEPAGKSAGRPPKPARRGSRVLVVDDNEDTAIAISKLLKLRGHDVKTAYDGPRALETAQAHAPQFVLLDIGLPGMDGYQVATRLREGGLRQAVIIAVSGYGQEDDIRRSRDAGIDHHLLKPVDYDALIALMVEPAHAE